jgi:hypothetical protein
MPTAINRRLDRSTIPLVQPDPARFLTEPFERCGHCMQLWPSADMRNETRADGLTRVCPLAASPSTDLEYTANVRQQVAEMAEQYIPMPRISQAPMELPLPATVMSIETASGVSVHQSAPYRILRNAAGLLNLIGINFPLSDAACLALITFPAGLATGIGAAVNVDGTLIELSFTVAALAAVGTYSITFNGATLKSVLLVR